MDGLTKNKKKRPAAGNDDSKSTDEDSGSPFAELPTEYSSRKKDVAAGRKRVSLHYGQIKCHVFIYLFTEMKAIL